MAGVVYRKGDQARLREPVQAERTRGRRGRLPGIGCNDLEVGVVEGQQGVVRAASLVTAARDGGYPEQRLQAGHRGCQLRSPIYQVVYLGSIQLIPMACRLR